MKRMKVDISAYPTEVIAYGITTVVKVDEDVVLELYPDESKRLRKALKKAERAQREARR